jgi:hypothetical protein
MLLPGESQEWNAGRHPEHSAEGDRAELVMFPAPIQCGNRAIYIDMFCTEYARRKNRFQIDHLGQAWAVSIIQPCDDPDTAFSGVSKPPTSQCRMAK